MPTNSLHLLIHIADPHSRPVVITIFVRSVCPSNLAKQKFDVRIVIATGVRNGGSGQVDHCLHTCSLFSLQYHF